MPFHPRSELGELTDEQLCHGWRASYVALQQRLSTVQVIVIVEQTAKYFDELERRNAHGFSPAHVRRAGTGNPALSLQSRVHHPTINWDELIRGQDR